MGEHGRELATRSPPAIETLPTSAALSKLHSECPACGTPSEPSVPCAHCGHSSERARWSAQRREKRSILSATFGSISGEYALIGLLFLFGAVAVFRVGFSRSTLLSCVAAWLAAMSLPLMLTGARKAFRVATKRRWRYDAPDGVACIADGTPWAIESVIRVRPLGIQALRAPDELRAIDSRHARSLTERPDVVAGLRHVSRAALKGATRERAEACVAVAIALARMELEGAVRLSRSELLRTTRVLDGEPIEEKSLVFGVAAVSATHGDSLAEWIFRALPRSGSEQDAAHYRETASVLDARSPGQLADLDAVLSRHFRRDQSESATVEIRTKINASGGWHSEAPSLTMEGTQWLAELAGCVWDAMSAAERSNDEER